MWTFSDSSNPRIISENVKSDKRFNLTLCKEALRPNFHHLLKIMWWILLSLEHQLAFLCLLVPMPLSIVYFFGDLTLISLSSISAFKHSGIANFTPCVNTWVLNSSRTVQYIVQISRYLFFRLAYSGSAFLDYTIAKRKFGIPLV